MKILWTTIKRKEIGKDLGHNIPPDLLKNPTNDSNITAVMNEPSEYININDDYVTESNSSENRYIQSNYIVVIASSEESLLLRGK